MSKRNVAATRQRLVLVLLTFTAASAAVWFFLLEGPRVALKKQQEARSTTQAALDKSRKQISDATRTREALEANRRRLEAIEEKMPIGDPYRWLVKAFGEFAPASRVVIGNIEAPHISESGIYPQVPYKTATFTLSGTGFFHDFGTFLAELENEFPHMRVRRLELSPAYPGEPESAEGEKLGFQIELMVLFKSAAAVAPTQLSQAPTAEKKN